MTSKEYLLGELRCASLRARLVGAEIDAIGTAVKDEVVSPEEALLMIVHSGLIGWFSNMMESALAQVSDKMDSSKYKKLEQQQ